MAMSNLTFYSYIVNMATIGIYDSGMGGLTTLKLLLKEFNGNDFYYLADNLHHPFGNKKQEDIDDIVHDGVKRLKAHSDIQILACNTSSFHYRKDDVFKLYPPLDKVDNNTLLMATDATLNCISGKYKSAQTSALATLIEVHIAHSLRKNNINLDSLLPYLKKNIGKFYGVKNVILGCSHYPFVIPQIRKILGNVNFYDGNEKLINELAKNIEKRNKKSQIIYDFTGENQTDTYQKITTFLMSDQSIFESQIYPVCDDF